MHSNESLIKHPDILRAVSTGQVNIGEFLLGQFGNEDPVFAADNVPFVAPGYDSAFKFYQAQKPVLEKKLQGRGLKLLYAVAWPGQGIYTRDPLKSAADLKGQKMRTYSPLTSRLAELLGATGVQTQVTDVPQMFATGAMQAMVTSSATGTSTKAWEFVKNYYQDQRLESEERGGGERARLRAPAQGAAGRAGQGRGGRRAARLGDVQGAREGRRRDAGEERRHGRRSERPSCARRSPRSASRWPRSGKRPPAPTARRS